MTTYLVTRHPATRLWAQTLSQQGRLPFVIDQATEHLDVDALAAGDVVVGTLPMHIAAQLHGRKIAFWSLDLDVPMAERGMELDIEHLARVGARFTRYEVRDKGRHDIAASADADEEAADSEPHPSITLIPVSAQLAPAAIGWLHQPTEQVWLLVSGKMNRQRKLLQAWFNKRSRPPRVHARKWDDGSYASLIEQSEALAQTLSMEQRPEVVLNLTGGTKPMSMALQRAFGKRMTDFARAPHGQYVDTQHHVLAELLREPTDPAPMRSVLNINDILTLQGIRVESAQSACSGHEDWMRRKELFELLLAPKTQNWLGSWYRILGHCDWLANPKSNRRGKPGSSDGAVHVEWHGNVSDPEFIVNILEQNKFGFDWATLRQALQGQFGKLLKADGVCDFEIDETENKPVLSLRFQRQPLDELAFAMGVWMEAWLASLFEAAGVDDWAQGVTVKRGDAKNEFDLIAMCGNQTLVIEAKTANLTRDGKQDSKGKEAVYKFDALSDKLGQSFNQRWLVSLRQMHRDDLEQASRHRLTVFHAGEEKHQAKTLSNLPEAINNWIKKCQAPLDDGFTRSNFPPAD